MGALFLNPSTSLYPPLPPSTYPSLLSRLFVPVPAAYLSYLSQSTISATISPAVSSNCIYIYSPIVSVSMYLPNCELYLFALPLHMYLYVCVFVPVLLPRLVSYLAPGEGAKFN